MDRINAIYTYPFVGSITAELIAKHEFSPRDVKLIVPEGTSFDDDEIIRSMVQRIPVFMGHPIYDAFHESEMPCSVEECFASQKPGMVYAISGIAYTEKTPIHVVHTYAPNMAESNLKTESNHDKSTVAFNDYMVYKGAVRVLRYKKHMSDMFDCIFKAAIKHCPHGTVYIPLIGQGSFAKPLTSYQRHRTLRLLFLSCRDVLTKFSELRVCVVGLLDIPVEVSLGLYTKTNMFDLCLSKDDTIVNAWDDYSYIGNGGSRDRSIDGWLVSGTGRNVNMKNTSYLHNVFFNPELLNPKNWIR